tara:strand:+ start:35 stop:193 length:159 start_codon:yes stop_codon:yes gene_type:complete
MKNIFYLVMTLLVLSLFFPLLLEQIEITLLAALSLFQEILSSTDFKGLVLGF